jgi:hypothetical protein
VRVQLRAGVLTWLQLCVLEDRLERIVRLASAGEEYTRRLVKVCAACRVVVQLCWHHATAPLPRTLLCDMPDS